MTSDNKNPFLALTAPGGKIEPGLWKPAGTRTFR